MTATHDTDGRLSKGWIVGGAIAVALIISGFVFRQPLLLWVQGDTRVLREDAPTEKATPSSASASGPERPSLLILGIDGVDRDLLYSMLREGKLPQLAALLGGQPQGSRFSFPRAHFEDSFLSALPSSTIPTWLTYFTGEPPAVHGITGNEFFIREKREFVAPIPTTFSNPELVFKNFTEGYVNEHVMSSGVYEKLREREPAIDIWVAMHQYFSGADRLLMTDRGVFLNAFRAFVAKSLDEALDPEEGEEDASHEKARKLYASFDQEVMQSVTEELDRDRPPPDVLTVYLVGTDQFAHVSDDGPDAARQVYLQEIIDPLAGKLQSSLREAALPDGANALENRYVVLVSDHGHTEVVYDDEHALAMGEGDPPEVIEQAGFRLRPFQHEVADDHDFQAVLAYQGAMAYVYVADRSTCQKPGQSCDWQRAPRYEQDVLELAEAFHQTTTRGEPVEAMKGSLDLILVRRGSNTPDTSEPFAVYVGDGSTQSIPAYLRANPHPLYIELDSRLRALAVGPQGRRAGDIILIANNGNRELAKERYYFASPYRSWHGSPSRQDSQVPLIVAHPKHSSARLATTVDAVLTSPPRAHQFGELLLELRSPRRDSQGP